mgnify:CR=1 FL=1
MTEFSLESGAVAMFYRPSSAAVTVLAQGTPISGVDGTDGTDGRTILSGSGAPSSGLGADGDFYIDTTYPSYLYGPKAAGAWPSGVSLVGATGASGAAGGHPFLTMGG